MKTSGFSFSFLGEIPSKRGWLPALEFSFLLGGFPGEDPQHLFSFCVRTQHLPLTRSPPPPSCLAWPPSPTKLGPSS